MRNKRKSQYVFIAVSIVDKFFTVLYNLHRKAKPYNGRRLHSLPSQGGMCMQYVTYADLFQFVLVVIAVISLIVQIVSSHKKK